MNTSHNVIDTENTIERILHLIEKMEGYSIILYQIIN